MHTGLFALARRHALLVALLAWLLSLGVVSPAFGITLSAPADVPRSTTVTVTVEPADPAGVVTLRVDGSAVATASAAPGDTLAFPSVALAPGAHTLVASISDGNTTNDSAPVSVMSWARPAAPELLRPYGAGDSIAAAADVVARAGAWTSRMTILVQWQSIGTLPCTPGESVFFGILAAPREYQAWAVIAENPCGERTASIYHFIPVSYPASTSIVVDKSEYRLYWIANDILIRVYPVAIGKARTATPNGLWIVNRKEYMPPAGVYGPRRLKLARGYWTRRGWRWRATGYGIHGTNEPWVIGTMASHGCIRLWNHDILDLWPQVPLGTMVQTRP